MPTRRRTARRTGALTRDRTSNVVIAAVTAMATATMAAAAMIAAAPPARAALRPYVLLGAGLQVPAGDVADVYGTAIAPRAGIGLRPGGRPYEIALEAGYAWNTSRSLTASPFVSDAESRFDRIGFDLAVRVPFRGGTMRPYVGAAAEALMLREKFTYTLFGESRERTPDWQTVPGFLVIAGVSRVVSPRLGIEGAWRFARADVRIDQGRILDGSDEGSVGVGGLEARILWRLP